MLHCSSSGSTKSVQKRIVSEDIIKFLCMKSAVHKCFDNSHKIRKPKELACAKTCTLQVMQCSEQILIVTN